VDSNHRPSGYEPDELPLLHAAANAALASVEFSVLCFEFTSHQLNTENSALTTQLLVRRVVLRSQRTLRQYHRCCSVSRPGSGWFGVGPARSTHASGSGARCNWWNACSSPPRLQAVAGAGKPSPVRVARLYSSQSLQPQPLHPVISRGAYQPEAVSALILGGRSHLDAVSGSDRRP
jgi:hypothetical protein